MLHFYCYHLPELQTMRSVSGDYSLRAAVHRYTLVFRLPTRLFSAIKRTKQCLRAPPAAIENSAQILSTSGPSATATKSPCVQTVVPVEPSAVSGVCAMPTGKDKSQGFVIPIRITVSGRLGSRLSTLFKSVGKCAPSGPHHLENNPLPFKRRALATGPSDINESSICLIEFAREKGCSNHPFSSELPDPLCGNDYPPDYTTVIPEPQGPEDDQGVPGGDAIAKVPHQMSLGPNPAARTDACGATPGNRVIKHKKEEGFPNENVDDSSTCPTGGTKLDLEVVPSPALTLASSSVHNLGPTHEVKAVSQASRQPVLESNFLHFYYTLKPYIVQCEPPPRPVHRTPPPIDDGPSPESDGFRVLEGPFTTPAGGTNASEVKGPPCSPLPSPTNSEVLHERKPGVKHSDPCLAPAISALTDPTNYQLVSHSAAPARLSDEVLGKAMTWDIDILHARTGFSQTLNSTLRSMQSRWQILAFELAFGASNASMFRDNYGFASKPLALQPPCSSPRITELDDDDENQPVLRKATSEIQSYGGGEGGSSSSQAQQGSGSRVYAQSKSTQLPRGKKRANGEDGDDDRKGRKKKERREEPPVGDDPPPPGLEDGGVLCPYYVRDRRNCRKKSCLSPKKNLSKLKEHLRRAHFLHLGCPFENCVFNAGDKFQIDRHQKTAHAGQIREPIPRTTDSKLLRKNEALATRNLTWDEIYNICFREEPEEPTTGLEGGFEGGDEEEEEDDDDDDEDDGEYWGQEDHDDREAHGEQTEDRGGHTSNSNAAHAVDQNHQESLALEHNQSMLSNGASTIFDTPEPGEDFPFDRSEFPWPYGLNQGEGHPSPSPGRDTFPSFGQPAPSNPVHRIPWERAEEYIFGKFVTFCETYTESLGNRHGTSPRTAEQMDRLRLDIDEDLGGIEDFIRTAPNLVDGGSGPFTRYSKESFTRLMPSTSQNPAPPGFSMPDLLPNSPIGGKEPFTHLMPSTSQSPGPLDFLIPQGLFPSFPIGGHSSTLPSLTFDSQSSHNSIPPSMIPRALHQGRIPTVASSSQPTGPGTEGSQAGGRAVYGPDGDILVHKNPGGEWSVGSGPWDMQPHYDQSHS